MDNPMYPALACFAPFFAVLAYQSLTRRGQESKRVSPRRVVTAIALSLAIGIAGVLLSYIIL